MYTDVGPVQRSNKRKELLTWEKGAVGPNSAPRLLNGDADAAKREVNVEAARQRRNPLTLEESCHKSFAKGTLPKLPRRVAERSQKA